MASRTRQSLFPRAHAHQHHQRRNAHQPAEDVSCDRQVARFDGHTSEDHRQRKATVCLLCTMFGKSPGSIRCFLAKYYTTKGKQIRPGVFESTLADADAINAQQKCPVMDKPLGSMGVPQKVNVKGKSVYIYQAGCARKLHAQPDKYLALLTAQGIKPPDFE